MQDTVLNFISQYGYIAIFGSMVLGIVGLPIPDEVLLTFAGFLVYNGKLEYSLVIIAGYAGSISGVTLSYYIGHKFGHSFLEKHGSKIYLPPKRLKKAKKWFDRFGGYTLIFGYFIPGIRQFFAYYAGISKWRYPKFTAFAYLGGAIFVLTFVTVGRFLGEHWNSFSHTFHQYSVCFLIAILFFVGIYGFSRYYKKNK